MKKLFTLIFIISAAVMLPANRASAFSSLTENEFMTGESLDPGMTQAGINHTVGEHYVSYYPEIRYGMGALMEVGVRFGVTSARLASGENIGALMGAAISSTNLRKRPRESRSTSPWILASITRSLTAKTRPS